MRGQHLHFAVGRFCDLVAIMDWASRHLLAWRAVEHDKHRLLHRGAEGSAAGGHAWYLQHGQCAQFTSATFTDRVHAAGARCSMDGRGRCLDNVFIERLWRSLKYEAVYLHELADGFAAERVIAAMTFYSHVRSHSALAGRTPAEALRPGACGVSIRTARPAPNTAGVVLREQAVAPPVLRRSGPYMSGAVTPSVRRAVEVPGLWTAARRRAESGGRRGRRPQVLGYAEFGTMRSRLRVLLSSARRNEGYVS